MMEFHHSKYKNVTEAHREKQAGHCERSEHGPTGFRGGPQCSREKAVSNGAHFWCFQVVLWHFWLFFVIFLAFWGIFRSFQAIFGSSQGVLGHFSGLEGRKCYRSPPRKPGGPL